MKKMGLHKLISLTFDSDPDVRRQAAVELSRYDSPSSMFALVELTYDKDKVVRETARKILGEMKERSGEPELMSFADVFAKGENGGEKKGAEAAGKEKKEAEKAEDAKEKMLAPIEKMFENKLGKEKAEEVKKRMMPTIEKIYMKAMKDEGGHKKTKEERGKAVQEMLGGYLDVLAGGEAEAGAEKDGGQQSLAEELGLVGAKELRPEGVFREAEAGALEDEADLGEDASAEEKWLAEKGGSGSGPTVFKLAFDTMMASKGDEKLMKEAMGKMLKNTEDQIKMAFKVAKNRYSEINITNITELKEGMKRVNTGILYAKSVDHKEYQRTKTKKDTFTRIVVADQGGNEGVLYLFDERGEPIRPGMKLKVERGYAKTYDWAGETAMTVSKKGSVYIIL